MLKKKKKKKKNNQKFLFNIDKPVFKNTLKYLPFKNKTFRF